MDTTLLIPSAADVRRLLAGITLPRLRELAAATGVPFGTLYKIAVGETTNPGIDTARRFYPTAVAYASIQEPKGAATQQEARDAA